MPCRQLIQLPTVLHLVQLPMQMLYLLMKLKILLGVGHLLELFELLFQLDIVIVQLLALQPHLQCLQLLGGELGGEGLGGQVVRDILLGDGVGLVVVVL